MCKSRCCSLVIISALLRYFLYHGNMVNGQRTLQTYTFEKVDRNSVCVNVLSSSKQSSISRCLLKCEKGCFAVTFEASTGTCSLCSIQGLAVSENSTSVAFSKLQKQTTRNFIIIADQFLNWIQAKAYCNANHKGLAIISNEIEQENVHWTITDSKPRRGGYWIGGVRINNTLVWESHDNGYIPMSWFHWSSGQPTGNEQERCVMISGEQSQWYDVGCSTSQYFICNK